MPYFLNKDGTYTYSRPAWRNNEWHDLGRTRISYSRQQKLPYLVCTKHKCFGGGCSGWELVKNKKAFCRQEDCGAPLCSANGDTAPSGDAVPKINSIIPPSRSNTGAVSSHASSGKPIAAASVATSNNKDRSFAELFGPRSIVSLETDFPGITKAMAASAAQSSAPEAPPAMSTAQQLHEAQSAAQKSYRAILDLEAALAKHSAKAQELADCLDKEIGLISQTEVALEEAKRKHNDLAKAARNAVDKTREVSRNTSPLTPGTPGDTVGYEHLNLDSMSEDQVHLVIQKLQSHLQGRTTTTTDTTAALAAGVGDTDTTAALAAGVGDSMDVTASNKRSAEAALEDSDRRPGIEIPDKGWPKIDDQSLNSLSISADQERQQCVGDVGNQIQQHAVAAPATDALATPVLDGADLEDVEKFEGGNADGGESAGKNSQYFSKLAAQLHNKLEETGSHADSASAKSSRSAPYVQVDSKKGKGKTNRRDGGAAWDDLLEEKQLPTS